MYKDIIKVLLLGILLNGCASKQITPEELTKSQFSLPNAYKARISQKVIQKLINEKSKTGLSITYGNPNVYSPSQNCSRGLFSDDVTCKYKGNASITFDVPYLRKYGQRPTQKNYTYTILKNGSIYVY